MKKARDLEKTNEEKVTTGATTFEELIGSVQFQLDRIGNNQRAEISNSFDMIRIFDEFGGNLFPLNSMDRLAGIAAGTPVAEMLYTLRIG